MTSICNNDNEEYFGQFTTYTLNNVKMGKLEDCTQIRAGLPGDICGEPMQYMFCHNHFSRHSSLNSYITENKIICIDCESIKCESADFHYTDIYKNCCSNIQEFCIYCCIFENIECEADEGILNQPKKIMELADMEIKNRIKMYVPECKTPNELYDVYKMYYEKADAVSRMI